MAPHIGPRPHQCKHLSALNLLLFDFQISTILAMLSNLPRRSVRLSLLQTTVLLALGAPPVLPLGLKICNHIRSDALNENKIAGIHKSDMFLGGLLGVHVVGAIMSSHPSPIPRVHLCDWIGTCSPKYLEQDFR